MTNVPEFPKDFTPKGKDLFTQRGATRLAREIEQRWLDIGEPDVECRVEPVIIFNGQRLYVVRSNLVNGLPPAPGRRLAGQ